MARGRGQHSASETRRTRAILAIVCIATMLVAVNVIVAHYPPVRLDLTDERLYTLTPGTRLTLARIDETITLRFYYSPPLGEAIPAYRDYARRVRDLLDEYVGEARGKLRLEIDRPFPFSEAADRAAAFGLRAVPLVAHGEPVYFGLAGTNSTDDEQVIPFFAPQRERFLEYDLTRLVHALAYPKRVSVDMISGMPLDDDSIGTPGRPSPVLRQLRQEFNVKPLPPVLDAIPASTDVLMLVQPRNLPDRTLFAIEQFVLRGGGAIVFVDPYSELEPRGSPPMATPDSGLARLFEAWGIRLLPGTVAADRSAAWRIPLSGGADGGMAMDYVAWLNLRGDALNRDGPITARLRRIVLASAGIIEPLAGAETTVAPLITTSPKSMKLPAETVAAPPDATGLLARFQSDGRRYVLAARVTGPVATAFPNGAPDAADAPAKPVEPAERAEPPRRSAGRANVVVVADTDLLDGRFWTRQTALIGQRLIVPVANNADFVANAIEVLAGRDDLVDLRGRGVASRPFTLLDEIQREADDRHAGEQLLLQRKLQQAQVQLRNLTFGEQAGGAALTQEQSRVIEQLRVEIDATRRELRDVQAASRQDVELVKVITAFANIALVPGLVVAAAIVIAVLRRRHPAATG